MVNGRAVPHEVESKYRDYIKYSSDIAEDSVVCHMCFFYEQRHPEFTIKKREVNFLTIKSPHILSCILMIYV